MKTPVLIKTCLAAALAFTPAPAAVIVSMAVDGPTGSAENTGEFAERAWGRGATGHLGSFINPHVDLHEGAPPAVCCDALGTAANVYARVDATQGFAGATASAQPHSGQSSYATGSGEIQDVITFRAPRVVIDMDLIGSLSRHVLGDSDGSAGLDMRVFLSVPDPGNPDTPFRTIYGALISRWWDSEGKRWQFGSISQGFTQGNGDAPLSGFSETFLLPDLYVGVPVNLSMMVSASADCSADQDGGACSTRADGFDTGYLGITGDYTSTHAFPGRQPDGVVPEPHTFALIGIGLSVLMGSRLRGMRNRRDSPYKDDSHHFERQNP